MTSHYNSGSWRDDYDLDGVHPTIAHAIHDMHAAHAADVLNRRLAMEAASAPAPASARWPFPLAPIPVDKRTPPPRHPDPEDAPW
jgi:hypothetical protein